MMLDQLERGEIDFCQGLSSGYNCGRKKYLFVYHSAILWLGGSMPHSMRLAGKNLSCLKRATVAEPSSDQLFAGIGMQPTIAEGEEVVSIMGFVAANLGITLLPYIAGMDMLNVSRLSIADVRCERIIGFALEKRKM